MDLWLNCRIFITEKDFHSLWKNLWNWSKPNKTDLRKLKPNQSVITRVVLGPNDVLTPFDLRTQTFRVNVELATYYHKHTRKKIFEPKGYFRTFFQKIFFRVQWPRWGSNGVFWATYDQQYIQNFFSRRKVTLGHFFEKIFFHCYWP